jgi:hypothetical protein
LFEIGIANIRIDFIRISHGSLFFSLVVSHHARQSGFASNLRAALQRVSPAMAGCA